MEALAPSRITIHMGMSLDGFIARPDGRVDWMETRDTFPDGVAMDKGAVAAYLAAIDCYVMGSRTYEVALGFARSGAGWAYGEKPVYVLTSRTLDRARESVSFHAGDLAAFLGTLRARHRNIWIAGGPSLAADCLRLGLADEISYSVLPVLIGEGVPFFDRLGRDVPLHLLEAKAWRNGIVALRYEVQR